jgi:hypothetical protein
MISNKMKWETNSKRIIIFKKLNSFLDKSILNIQSNDYTSQIYYFLMLIRKIDENLLYVIRNQTIEFES